MSLAKSDKGFLEVKAADQGFVIVAKKPDADALAVLYGQRGIRCHLRPDVRPGEDALQFDDSVQKDQVEQVLEGYRTANGS